MNPDTGESMPIPEAMDKGLILVEFTNSSIERDNIQKGILTTTTTKEDVTYTIQVRPMNLTTLPQAGECPDIIQQQKHKHIRQCKHERKHERLLHHKA